MTKPYLLVAMPQLTDPNFNRTVVLVASHSQEGAFGLVLNRPAEVKLGKLEISNLKIHEALQNTTVWFGGPCSPERIWLLHRKDTIQKEGEIVLGRGLVLSSSSEWLEAKDGPPKLEPDQFHLFSGHAEWTSRQLDKEIQYSSWLTAPLDPEVIFATPPEKMWEQVIRRIGINPHQLATETSQELH